MRITHPVYPMSLDTEHVIGVWVQDDEFKYPHGKSMVVVHWQLRSGEQHWWLERSEALRFLNEAGWASAAARMVRN